MASHRIITGELETRQSEAELRGKNLYGDIRDLAIELGEAANYTDRRDIFNRNGWQTDHTAYIRKSRPRFHGYKNRVAVECVSDKNRARVRSDILCLESCSRDKKIDAGVVITTRDSDVHFGWIDQDLNDGILDDYIFSVPLHIIETESV